MSLEWTGGKEVLHSSGKVTTMTVRRTAQFLNGEEEERREERREGGRGEKEEGERKGEEGGGERGRSEEKGRSQSYTTKQAVQNLCPAIIQYGCRCN